MSVLLALAAPPTVADIAPHDSLSSFFLRSAQPFLNSNPAREFAYLVQSALVHSPAAALRSLAYSPLCYVQAARNPTLLAYPPLLLASNDPEVLVDAALSYLRLLHLSFAAIEAAGTARLCISRVDVSSVTSLLENFPSLQIVARAQNRRVYITGPRIDLDNFRSSLPVPSSARFVDPVPVPGCLDVSLAQFARDKSISIFSRARPVRAVAIVDPCSGSPIDLHMHDDVTLAQDLLLNLISCTDVDDLASVTALSALDIRHVLNLHPSPNDAPIPISPSIPRIAPTPPVYSATRDSSSIAIIGISCRLPGAESLDQFWQNLVDGLDTHQVVPPRLFNIKDYQSPSYKDKNTMRASHMNVLDRPGLFDPRLFSEPTDAASYLDPQQRLALMTSYEALEMASLSANFPDTDKAGVFVGVCSDDYREHLSKPVEQGLYANTFRSHISTRLSSYFGFHGPSLTYDTACSSALVTIEAACSYLVSGKCSIALAGGVNVLTQPQISIGLDRGFFLSSTGQCKTFDKSADGYCRSDAIGFVVLKRLDDAVRDNDRVLGVISAASTNHSGLSYSITHPHGPTQAQLYRSGLEAAALEPSDIDYIECHGTGTQAGDAEEMQGLLDIFASNGKHRDKNRDRDLVVGSVKANLGHSESCSGATALLKTLLAFQHERVPTHVGIKSTINPIFPTNLAELGIKIPLPKDGVPLPRKEVGGRVALVNNFSAAGGNTSLVIKDAPPRRLLIQDGDSTHSPGHHLFVYSAQTTDSLRQGLVRLKEFINSNSTLKVEDVCYTLAKGRRHHDLRLATVVSSLSDIVEYIDKSLTNLPTAKSPKYKSLYHYTQCRDTSEKVQEYGWAFTGQGSQWRGMGKTLYKSSPVFAESIDNIRLIARSFDFADFLAFIVDAPETDGDASPVCTQLAIFALEVSIARLLIAAGLPKPTVVAGHSLGEYAALVQSGVISLQEGIYLVGKRATLVEALCERGASSMLTVQSEQTLLLQFLSSLDQDDSTKLDDGLLWANVIEVACRNSPTDTVLAGPKTLIERLKDLIKSRLSIRCMVLDTPYAFHSAAVEPIIEPFSKIVEEMSERTGAFKASSSPSVRLLSNVHGKVIEPGHKGQFDKDYLLRHARSTVNFVDGFDDLMHSSTSSPTNWIEIGPHPALSPMIKLCLAGATITPTLKRSTDSNMTVLKLLEGLFLSSSRVNIDDVDFYRWSKALGWDKFSESVWLPTYSFDQKEYWINFSDRGLRPHLVASTRKRSRTPKKSAAVAPKPQRPALPKQQPSSAKYALLSKCVYFNEKAAEDQPTAILEVETKNNDVIEKSVMGHKICGRGMAPATLLSEVAFQAGEFMREFEESSDSQKDAMKKAIISVLDMDMTSSLLMDESSTRPIIRVCVFGSLSSSFASGNTGKHVSISFSSRNPGDMDHVHHHATCQIALVQPDALNSSWAKLNHLVQHRVHRLVQGVKSTVPDDSNMYDSDEESEDEDEDIGDLFKREMTYRLFGKLVDYSKEYQGMRSVWLSADGMEATTNVKMDSSVPLQNGFTCNPFLQDSVGQSSGFIPNVGMADDQNVYIANGIGAITFTPLMAQSQNNRSAAFSTYCRMSPSADGQFVQGDVWIFRPHDLALYGLFADVRFRKLKETIYRRLMLDHHTAPAKNALISQPIPRSASTERTTEIVKEEKINGLRLGGLQLFDAKPGGGDGGPFTPSSSVSPTPREDRKDLVTSPSNRLSTELQPADLLRLSSSSSSSVSSLHRMNDETKGFQDGGILSPFSQRSSSASLASFPATPTRTSPEAPLFLLPDGSGCAAVYDEVRTCVGKSREIFCLSSPFFRDTESWTGGLDQILDEFEKEILSTRAQGPYSIGGWSFGGMVAYELAARLTKRGHEIDSLFIIDSPLPLDVTPLSKEGFNEICRRIDETFEKSPIKKSVSTSTWSKLVEDIKQHFAVCSSNVAHFTSKNKSLLDTPPRKTILVHAVNNQFFDSIKTANPNEWRKLFKHNAALEFISIRSDHFGLVRSPAARQVADLLSKN